MKSTTLRIAAIGGVLAIAASCGSSPRRLVSMNLNPAVANAADFANGQVQFSASGTYSAAPRTGAVTPILWAIYVPSSQQNPPKITQSGLAECGAAAGNFSVMAYANADPSQTTDIMHAKKVVLGTASLICP